MPLKLDIESIKKTAENLLCHDETMNALWLLSDGLPGEYRENPPQELVSLKKEIMAKMATGAFYAQSQGYELSAPDESYKYTHQTLRGAILIEDVKRLNQAGRTPHIVDLAPGEYWMPRMLEFHNLQFTYFPVWVNYPSYEKYKPHFDKFLREKAEYTQPTIYFCGEIIEHLFNPIEIRFNMERYAPNADIIHISTPHNTFNTEVTDWRTIGDLGHLRTFTVMEFDSSVKSMFQDYVTMVYQSKILHARLVNKETKFESVLDSLNKNILEGKIS